VTADTHLVRARTAAECGDWRSAIDALDVAASDGIDGDETAEMLELRAQAAYGCGELEDSVEAWERLHSHELQRNDHVAAARAAAMIAMYLMMDTGLMAPVRGWLATADRLLAGTVDTPAHAIVAMTRTYERFMCGDMDAARVEAERAIDLGRATGVTPAVVIGMTARARVRIFDGDVDGGLAQLDEVGALLMGGGADPLTTGMMYCELICAAQGLGLHDMAAEWTEVMEHWRHGAAFGGINGRCRVHRAELLRVSGPCDEAEAEALGACDELRPWMRREFGWPLVELGNIRLRRGDLAGAEEAYLEAHEHAWSPQPGLALLRLAQGDTETASVMIADAIEVPFDIPSKERPPFGDLRLAPLLDAQAEIGFAAADADTVRHAAGHLADIASRYPGRVLRSWATLAAARANLLDGDTAGAIERCSAVASAWTEMGAPYEAASARMLLGRAYEAAGRTEAARMEWNAAAALFRRFGAERRADDAAARAGAADRAAPAAEEPDVGVAPSVSFVAADGHRTIVFQGRTTTMRDLKGLRFIARLVAEPGREIHVLDLVAADEGVLRPDAAHPDRSGASTRGDAGLPALDDTARDAYRRRLAEIDDDIDEARRMNDSARVELAEHDREYLVAELRRAVGLGGRHRTVGGSAERARTSVTRSIRYAIGQLAAQQPELAGRLQHCVHTGTYCSYQPDRVAPLAWQL
jgi:tetratricopeptide (TPR) repeat protein